MHWLVDLDLGELCVESAQAGTRLIATLGSY
jgi:hypothetical protein